MQELAREKTRPSCEHPASDSDSKALLGNLGHNTHNMDRSSKENKRNPLKLHSPQFHSHRMQVQQKELAVVKLP